MSAYDVLDYAEDYMDDLLCLYEDFIKKSLLLVSVTIGALVVMLAYVLKMYTDRNNLLCPARQTENNTPESCEVTCPSALPEPGGSKKSEQIPKTPIQIDVNQSNPACTDFNQLTKVITVKGKLPDTNKMAQYYNYDPQVNKAAIKPIQEVIKKPLKISKEMTSNKNSETSDKNLDETTPKSSIESVINKKNLNINNDSMIEKIIKNEPITSNNNSNKTVRHSDESQTGFQANKNLINPQQKNVKTSTVYDSGIDGDNISTESCSVLASRLCGRKTKINEKLSLMSCGSGRLSNRGSTTSIQQCNSRGKSVSTDVKPKPHPICSVPSFDCEDQKINNPYCPYRPQCPPRILRRRCSPRSSVPSIPSCAIKKPLLPSRSHSNLSTKSSCCSVCCRDSTRIS